MVIKDNIANLLDELSPYNARLVAVSKTHAIEKIREAYDSGQRCFGENKVQELVKKQAALPPNIEWHLIGHLQRNKARDVVGFVTLIHAVDSFRLLEEINMQGKKINRVVHCLFQIFIATEETKFGFSPQELMELVRSPQLAALEHVQIDGLMGMASFTENTNQIRSEFRSLKQLFDKVKALTLTPNIQMKELSMGMSSDFQIALEEGSTLVRVGTGVFGRREETSNKKG